jgi:hypothetical protein
MRRQTTIVGAVVALISLVAELISLFYYLICLEKLNILPANDSVYVGEHHYDVPGGTPEDDRRPVHPAARPQFDWGRFGRRR